MSIISIGNANIDTDAILTGQQIKILLAMNGMTAKELAEQVGISPKYMSKIVNGERSGATYMDKIKTVLIR